MAVIFRMLDVPKMVAYETWDHESGYRDAVGKGEVTLDESLEILRQRITDKLTELTEAKKEDYGKVNRPKTGRATRAGRLLPPGPSLPSGLLFLSCP
jgi:hypothetical protein